MKRALEMQKPVLMLNVGPTRADGLEGFEKIEWHSGTVLPDACELLLSVRDDLQSLSVPGLPDFDPDSDVVTNDQPYHRTDRLPKNPILQQLLKSGHVTLPPEDDVVSASD